VLKFWRNPEFIRHVRAELRPPRAITAAFLAIVVCVLVGLGCWASEQEKLRDFFRMFHGWLVGLQFVGLAFWCASGCGQAVTRERELKTYDFLKTTRLTAGEIVVGKILGAPIMAYFVVGCTLPISLVAGALGGYGVGTLAGIYALLLAFALFVSLVGLWLSMLLEKSSSAAVALLTLLPIGWTFSLAYSPFSGLGSLSALPTVFRLYGLKDEAPPLPPTLFGVTVPSLAVSLLLYAAFGAWLVLMLVRNLKRDREQVVLLSRWQAVGLGAFLNVLFYALLNPQSLTAKAAYHTLQPEEVTTLAVAMNGLFIFVVGLTTLAPHERLKVWWRRRATGEETYLSASGLSWPWLIAVALVAYVLLVAEAAGLRSAIALERWHLGKAAIELFVLLIFAVRDVLFLQWCNVTRMKRPLVKGVLYLMLYYFAVSMVGLVVAVTTGSESNMVFDALTPYGPFMPQGGGLTRLSPAIYVGMGVQITFILLILKAIAVRLSRPAISSAATTPA
jgi:ABC-type transport system involved in multi-copper enzyme maturation permease subunit